MNQLLKPQMEIQTESGMACRVEAFLGGGGQGEVYRGLISEKPVAIKWYFLTQVTDAQRTALVDLIQRGAPNDKFLWPISLVSTPDIHGFGYVMPLQENRHGRMAGSEKWLCRKQQTSLFTGYQTPKASNNFVQQLPQ